MSHTSVNLNNYVCICSTYPPKSVLVEGVGDGYKLHQVKYLGNDNWITDLGESISIYYWRFSPVKK